MSPTSQSESGGYPGEAGEEEERLSERPGSGVLGDHGEELPADVGLRSEVDQQRGEEE